MRKFYSQQTAGGFSPKTYLVIYKDGGKFYKAKGIDAFILHNLFGYKVINNKCGFPDTIINRILEKLITEKISYEIVYSDSDSERKSFKLNNYSKHYEQAVKTMDINQKISLIEEKLSSANLEKLEKILDVINEIL